VSSSLQVRIARAGKEIGTYDSAEVIRLLGVGTLDPTDHYWHDGMTSWALLSDLERTRRDALDRVVKARLAREELDDEVEARLIKERKKRHREKNAVTVPQILSVFGVFGVWSELNDLGPGERWTSDPFGIVLCGAAALIGLGLIIKKRFEKK
jgi:hypothetical protein